MKNRTRPPAWFATAFAAAFAGGFIALWLTDYAVIRADWCSGVEAACMREWIGSLSGWAAAAGAGFTILVLIRQTAAVRRQTEFVVGDGLPTLAFVQDDSFGVKLRLVNWNKDALRLLDFTVSCPSEEIALPVLRVYRNDGVTHDPAEFFPGASDVDLKGWEDRGGPPPFLNLEATVARTNDNGPALDITIRVRCLILGSSQRQVEIVAEGHGLRIA